MNVQAFAGKWKGKKEKGDCFLRVPLFILVINWETKRLDFECVSC